VKTIFDFIPKGFDLSAQGCLSLAKAALGSGAGPSVSTLKALHRPSQEVQLFQSCLVIFLARAPSVVAKATTLG
jgi:hypothetical protein